MSNVGKSGQHSSISVSWIIVIGNAAHHGSSGASMTQLPKMYSSPPAEVISKRSGSNKVPGVVVELPVSTELLIRNLSISNRNDKYRGFTTQYA